MFLHPKMLLRAQWHRSRKTGIWGTVRSNPNDQNGYFWTFSIFSKTVDEFQTELLTVILYRIRVLCVQLHQNRMAGI